MGVYVLATNGLVGPCAPAGDFLSRLARRAGVDVADVFAFVTAEQLFVTDPVAARHRVGAGTSRVEQNHLEQVFAARAALDYVWS